MRNISGELFSCDKQRGISAANSFPAINNAEYRRRAPRRQPFFDLVRRRAPRRQPFLVLVHRRAPRQQPFLVLVHRRAPRRQPFLVFVRRRAPRRQPFLVLSIGELFAGNLLSFCPSAEPLPETFSRFSPSASTSSGNLLSFCPSANYSPATFSRFVHRRTIRRQPSLVLSVGGASSGNLFSI
ncbi:hypothetical protein SAMN02745202_00570 [Segatella oulorum]|uniref:Uncharacterized protein n=1 Tax=Segatella oulorum TaxID=28136 RepID=A0A1T4LZY5_9BACT|nr:hypothetical protein SAMN02745202_00570 [Segatella oulorum]